VGFGFHEQEATMDEPTDIEEGGKRISYTEDIMGGEYSSSSFFLTITITTAITNC
jgi:hypothetical protein